MTKDCDHEPGEGAGPHGETLCVYCGAVLATPRRTHSHRIEVVRAGRGITEINVVPRETR